MDRIVKKLLERVKRKPKKSEGRNRPWNNSGSSEPGDDWQAAKRLKSSLMKEYEGIEVSEATDCRTIENEYGEVLCSVDQSGLAFTTTNFSDEVLLSDLQLLYGIGPCRERQLKNEGYTSIKDLRDHNRWREEASSFLSTLQDSDPGELKKTITRWKSSSHPYLLTLSGLYGRNDYAIVDIETLGLTYQPVILFGLGLPTDEGVEVHQILLADIDQEPAALLEFKRLFDGKRVLITYNGKRFDLPYIRRRYNFYGLSIDSPEMHYDLYQFVRSYWKDQLPDCSLDTVEEVKLQIDRPIDIPSALVPDFYQTYRSSSNPGPLIPILEHNRQDILSLANLFHVLSQSDCCK